MESIQSPYHIEALLQLRRYEKDYLLREEGEYIQKHENQLNNLRNQIIELNDNESNRILSELKTYETAFNKYVSLQEKIGRTNNEGLQGEFFRSIQSIEPYIYSNDIHWSLRGYRIYIVGENKAIDFSLKNWIVCSTPVITVALLILY